LKTGKKLKNFPGGVAILKNCEGSDGGNDKRHTRKTHCDKHIKVLAFSTKTLKLQTDEETGIMVGSNLLTQVCTCV